MYQHKQEHQEDWKYDEWEYASAKLDSGLGKFQKAICALMKKDNPEGSECIVANLKDAVTAVRMYTGICEPYKKFNLFAEDTSPKDETWNPDRQELWEYIEWRYASEKLESGYEEFQNVINTLMEKDKHDDAECTDYRAKLREVVTRICEQDKRCNLFAGDTVPKEEKRKPLADRNERRKRNREEDDEFEEEERHVAVKVIISAEKMGHVIGRRHANKERLEQKYGIRMSVPEQGGKEILLKGPADRVEKARREIIDNLPCDLTYPLNRRFIRSLVGYGGEAIRNLSDDHNVSIELLDEKIIISGKRERCLEAANTIKSMLAIWKGGD